jgi:hypothetical protein
MRNVVGLVLVLTVIAMLSLSSLSSLGWCDEIILNEHVTLTSFDSPDSRVYQFNLTTGDTISMSISVLGDSIDLYIYNNTGYELLQRTNIFDLEEQLTVPYNGTFQFIIETFASESANAVVDITLTRASLIPEFQYLLAVLMAISLIAVAIAKASGDKYKRRHA